MGFGYGDGDDATVLDDMQQIDDDPDTVDVDESQPGYLTVYCRKTVNIPDLGGFTNLVLSVVLLKYTGLGLYGVALATVLTYLARSIAFTPVYSALILGERATRFLRPILPGLLMLAALSGLGWAASRTFHLASYPALLLSGALAGAVYAPLCLLTALNGDERRFLASLILKGREGS